MNKVQNKNSAGNQGGFFLEKTGTSVGLGGHGKKLVYVNGPDEIEVAFTNFETKKLTVFNDELYKRFLYKSFLAEYGSETD
jgi:hypothetical protein